jgi:NhaP-type Na+/H+ or K+/H+ antiporter
MKKTCTIVGALIGASAGFFSMMVSYVHPYRDEPPFNLNFSLIGLAAAILAGTLLGWSIGWLLAWVQRRKRSSDTRA